MMNFVAFLCASRCATSYALQTLFGFSDLGLELFQFPDFRIDDLLPVFIVRIWGCNGLDGACDGLLLDHLR